MKNKEEIEQLAEQKYFHVDGFEEEISEGKRHFIAGYTQCQEDMKPLLKTLFALWETLAERGEISVGIDFTKHYEILKQQLNKQDYDKNY